MEDTCLTVREDPLYGGRSEGKYTGFYRKLRSIVSSFADRGPAAAGPAVDIIFIAPDIFCLMVRLMADPRVDPAVKVKISAMLGYFVLPLDMLPEGILGAGGFLDDVALSCALIDTLFNGGDEGVIRSNWPGSGDAFTVIRNVSAKARRILGKKFAADQSR